MSTPPLKTLMFCLLALVPTLAHAQLDCIVPTREEGFDANRPGAEALRRAAFDAYRASLTPSQLDAPGTISDSTTPAGAPRVDDPKGRPLARIDPAYAQRRPGAIHLITVSLAPQPKTDPEYAWQQASYEALDYGALARLVGE